MIKPVVLFGNPATQIVEYSMDNNSDMIVVGNRGLSDIKGMMNSKKFESQQDTTTYTVETIGRY